MIQRVTEKLLTSFMGARSLPVKSLAGLKLIGKYLLATLTGLRPEIISTKNTMTKN